MAKHIQVGGNLFLIDSYVNGEANLSGAKIGGNLDCSQGLFINSPTDNSKTQDKSYALDTSLAVVDGEVCFNSFKVNGHVLALEMKVGGDFDCTGGRIEHTTGNCHAISIDRSSIGGDVLLCQGFSATGQVRLIGTKIAGDLDCSGGTFKFFPNKENDTNALYAPRAKVEGSVFLCECMREPENDRKDFVTNGWINLELTNINHSIKIGRDGGNKNKTSIFEGGGISLKNAKVTGSFEWIEVRFTRETKLNLRGAMVGNLHTVTNEEENWPELFLDGLVYDAITHNETKETTFAKVMKAVRSFLTHPFTNYNIDLRWLQKQKIFDPQIYEQLATVLRRTGRDADAIKVSIAKEKIRRKPKNWYERSYPWNWLPCLWSFILWIFIGYGYKAHRALLGAVFLIILGLFIFCEGYYQGIIIPTNKEAYKEFTNNELSPSYTPFDSFAYSFDAFLPIGKLQQQEKWHPAGDKTISIPFYIPFVGIKEFPPFPLRYYLYFIHIPLGWLLTTLGLAGLLQTIARNK